MKIVQAEGHWSSALGVTSLGHEADSTVARSRASSSEGMFSSKGKNLFPFYPTIIGFD